MAKPKPAAGKKFVKVVLNKETGRKNYIDQANQGFHELEPTVKDIDIDATDIVAEDYDFDAQSYGGTLKSNNPEGDALVLRFLKGIAKKFDYPVAQAAIFVKERIKKLGY